MINFRWNSNQYFDEIFILNYGYAVSCEFSLFSLAIKLKYCVVQSLSSGAISYSSLCHVASCNWLRSTERDCRTISCCLTIASFRHILCARGFIDRRINELRMFYRIINLIITTLHVNIASLILQVIKYTLHLNVCNFSSWKRTFLVYKEFLKS